MRNLTDMFVPFCTWTAKCKKYFFRRNHYEKNFMCAYRVYDDSAHVAAYPFGG